MIINTGTNKTVYSHKSFKRLVATLDFLLLDPLAKRDHLLFWRREKRRVDIRSSYILLSLALRVEYIQYDLI